MESDLFLKIIEGDVLDALKTLPDESVNLIVTSPPYWGLRSYLPEDHPDKKFEIGLEPTLDEYLDKLLKVTAELKRVLRKDGVMFWNHGDSYGGSLQGYGAKEPSKTGFQKPAGIDPRYVKGKPPLAKARAKCMMLQNYRLAIRMIDEQGWILRNVIIWYKPNHMPSSAKDRFTSAYEPVFFFVKSKKYWSDLDAVRVPHKTTIDEYMSKLPKSENNKTNFEGGGGIIKYSTPETIKRRFALGKNPGDVWDIPTQPFSAKKLGIEDVDHFATFPEELVRRIIKFGCPKWICKKCGKPRVRIVQKGESMWKHTTVTNEHRPKENAGFNYSSKVNGKTVNGKLYFEWKLKHPDIFVGWTDCGCNAGWRPGVVLDPFMGSGTTLKVARELGCSAIGIELNPDYVRIAKKRVNWGVGLDVEFEYVKI